MQGGDASGISSLIGGGSDVSNSASAFSGLLFFPFNVNKSFTLNLKHALKEPALEVLAFQVSLLWGV